MWFPITFLPVFTSLSSCLFSIAWTINLVERFKEDIRRRNGVIHIFPIEASYVRIVSALAIEINEEWIERKHLQMNAVEMTACGTPDAVLYPVENAPRFS